MIKTKRICILSSVLAGLVIILRLLSAGLQLQEGTLLEETSGDMNMPLPQPEVTITRNEKNTELSRLFKKHPGLTYHGLHLSEINLDTAPDVAENTFYEYVEHLDVTCAESRRFGTKSDGGWDWCLYGPYVPVKDNCLVYSFGIGTEWSFDDAISDTKDFGCIDRAFDPTNNQKDHIRGQRIHFYSRGIGGSNKVSQLIAYNRKHPAMVLRTFGAFREEFNDTYTQLDYLKMDVEYSEWEAFRTILYNGDLSNVKQIGIEIHTNEVFAKKHSSVELLKLYFDVLRGIEEAGFLKWHQHANMQATYHSDKTKKKRTCCYEMKFINWKLLSGDFDLGPKLVPVNKKIMWNGLTVGQLEASFDKFVHDIHHKCSRPVHINRQTGATDSEKIAICADEIKGESITIHTLGVNNSDVDVIRAGMESQFTGLVNIYAKNSNDITKALTDMKNEEIHLLLVEVDMACWNFIKRFLKSNNLKNVKQLVITVKTKESSGGETTIEDFIEYQKLLQSLQGAGFDKWLVKNSQSGMYDSIKTGNRISNAFQLYYLQKR